MRTPPTAIDMMRAERGTHFDPTVLEIFVDAIDDLSAIRTRYSPATPTAHVGGH